MTRVQRPVFNSAACVVREFEFFSFANRFLTRKRIGIYVFIEGCKFYHA